MKLAIGWSTKTALAGVLPLALGGTVFASSEVVDADAAAAGQELQFRLAAHLQIDADPRRQLVAATLLFAPAAPDSPVAAHAAAAARQTEAQAIYARVRSGTDDPWILWAAVTACQFGAQLCDADGAIDRLLRIAPDNAGVWQLALERAHRAKDRDGTLAALRGMAASKRHDIYFIEGLRAWSGAFATLAALPKLDPLIERTLRRAVRGVDAEREQAIDVLSMHSTFGWAFGIPAFGGLTEICMPEVAATGEWLAACRSAADLLLDSGTMLGVAVGTSVAYRLAQDDKERAMLERRRLHREWLMDAVGEIQREAMDETGLLSPALSREMLRSWSDASTEIEATRMLLRARNMSIEPPPEYTGRGTSLAEREAERLTRLP